MVLRPLASEVFVVGRSAKNSMWFYFLFVLMIAFGLCATGYYQTYDLKCGGMTRVWIWGHFPPQFECRIAF